MASLTRDVPGVALACVLSFVREGAAMTRVAVNATAAGVPLPRTAYDVISAQQDASFGGGLGDTDAPVLPPDEGIDDDAGPGDVFARCTRDWICRISVVCCCAVCLAVCVCALVRCRRRRAAAGMSRTQSLSSSVGTLLPPTNTSAAHAIQNYVPFQELWPGPQEWKKMSLQGRERVSAGVVHATTTVLYGARAPANAALLNDWVRSPHGIYQQDLETVRWNLDNLLCHMDPAQLDPSPLFGAPWPNHKRWRRLGNRHKAAVYAEYISDKLKHRSQIRRYAKWVRERGYLLNRVETAQEEAAKAVNRISKNLPVAYSDFKLDEATDYGCAASAAAAVVATGPAGLLDLESASEDVTDVEEGAPLLGDSEGGRAVHGGRQGSKGGGANGNGHTSAAAAAAAAANGPTPADLAADIPELSITRASLRTPRDPDENVLSREDSFSVFCQYLDLSPRLSLSDSDSPTTPPPGIAAARRADPVPPPATDDEATTPGNSPA